MANNPDGGILLIDDSPMWVASFGSLLESEEFDPVLTCGDSRLALDMIRDKDIGVVVLDLDMPHLSGEVVLQVIIENFPEIPVIMMTGTEDVEKVVSCMKIGACDYFTKTSEPARLISGVRKAFELRRLKKENADLKVRILDGTLKNAKVFESIVTESPAMKSIFRYIEATAMSPESVLITGESGVGKELIARAIHDASERKGELVSLNVAGLDDEAFSDTLFGHKKGAFTGAETVRKGLIERAAGGTLFLDEIGDMKKSSQIKLLRLLQEREYYALGSDTPVASDARIVVATNRDIVDMRMSGEIREDLYYRLHTHRIHLPPLRERREDIASLTDHFITQSAKTINKECPNVPKGLYTLLSTYDYPGNIRELKAVLVDAVSVHQTGPLSLDSIRSYIRQDQQTTEHSSVNETVKTTNELSFPERLPGLKEIQALLVEEAMGRAEGNQTIAAEMLKISRQSLYKRLKQSTRD